MHQFAVFSLRNRALIALVTVAVAVFGGIALTNLKQELAPSLEFPQLSILTSYPGAAPEVVNQDVSETIETAIQGVPGLDATTATSSTGLSLISASFDYSTNLDTAEQKITSAINRIRSTLPEGADPQVIRASFDDLPVLQIAISGGDTASLADRIDAVVIPELEQVDGVREAALLGAVGQRVSIVPDAEALAERGLTTQAISQTLAANGTLIPAGTVTEDGETLSVQAGTRLASVEDIRSLPVIGAGGTLGSGEVLTLADVATITLESNPQTSVSRVNGEDALSIAITKLPSANTVEVSHAIQELLPELEEALAGSEFTIVFDQAPFIEQSIEALTTEGLLGLVFAVLVILLFLFSIRSTLVTAISIPASVLITFIGIQFAGYTLNILTLGALTIAIGRVVDDSIVVIENIKRHLEYGQAKREAILTAVREVAGAITASTVTTVAVFLPISFVEGTTGELFRPFAFTVTIALLASLLVSLTIVPVLAYWFLGSRTAAAASLPATGRRGAKAQAKQQARLAAQLEAGEQHDESRLQKAYLPVLGWTLQRPLATLGAAVVILIGTFALVPFMQTNFLGATGQNTMTVSQEVEAAGTLEAKVATAEQAEEALGDIDGIETVQVSIGSSGSALRDAFSGGGSGTITYAITTDADADQDALQETVREALGDLFDPETLSVSSQGGFGVSNDITVDITAPDPDTLAEATGLVADAVAGLDSTAQSSSNLAETRPFVAVTIDRAAAAEYGLSEVALSGLVSQAMQPSTIGQLVIDGTTLQVYLTLPDAPQDVAGLQALVLFSNPLTGDVLLSDVATVEVAEGPASITSVRGLRSAAVTVTPNSQDIGTASAEIQQAIDELDLPAGAGAELGGVAADQSDAFEQLGIALLVAILIVYIVMVATFRSLLQPLLLLVSVPFAATGAIALQVATGIPLGVASLIGVLMLIGIVVTNAIVLVDLVNQYREKGAGVREALLSGAARRLRPILMTALATILALTPMALGITGHGGFISQPLAIVVIGGLLSSTLLTLVVLPVIYSLVEGPRERRRKRREQQRAADEITELKAALPVWRRVLPRRR